VIKDAAVALVMPKVDCIFVGCEAVLENGGVVNKLGTFTIALCAKTFQKPFYVFSESLKFMKVFPLKQVSYTTIS
jgi:translation initiation factor eIF-2B subunit alpha